MTTRKRLVRHTPGIAKSEAAWDDLVYFSETTDNSDSDRLVDRWRTGQARVTAEFMRDAAGAFDVVEHILDEESNVVRVDREALDG